MNRESIFRELLLVCIGLFLLFTGIVGSKTSPKKLDKPQTSITVSPTREDVPQPTPIQSGPTQVLGIQSQETFLVTKVVDGDTIQIEGGKTVRYIGIDTPETVDPRRPIMCFGKEASLKNKELVEGKQVRLEKDVSETDRYGRLLRYVYVDGTFVSDYLVRNGYAHASTYPPDVKYQEQFTAAQREAIDNNRGLWNLCDEVKSPQITGDKDCSDFKTHDDAQAFFISQGGPSKDQHKLDVDHDGIACESLP